MIHASKLQAAPLPAGAPHPDLVRLRDLIYEVAGIFHPNNKLALLQDRCGRRMKELNLPSLRKYIDCLTGGSTGQAELIALLDEITIGETCFFRNWAQLGALRRIVLPNILRAKLHSPHRLRLWSAGCSTGEEAYTLRMVLLEEAQGLLKNWRVEILATDLNLHSLAHAQAGVYDNLSTRNLPPLYRQKYFLTAGNNLRVAPQARADITFTRLNLSDDPRMTLMQNLDAIFCCNVLIYFDLASKRRVVQHFYANLLPGGYLFLGHAESLFQVDDSFRLVHFPGTTAYWKPTATPPGGAKK